MGEPQPTAIQRHHASETHTNATRQHEESTQRRLVLLNDRATALAASAKFEAALNDTITMQTIAPSSGMGYLCAGHVHQLQGRYRACIDVCDRGLAVVPSSDMYYQQLVAMRSMAVKHNNVHVDFIKELSWELVEIIVDNILTGEEIYQDQLCEYLSVCRLWQERILEHARDLHLVSIGYNDFGWKEHVLKLVAPYVTTLSSRCRCIPAYKLFQQAEFSSLRSLSLYHEGHPDDPDPALVLETLAAVQSTLAHLEVIPDMNREDVCYSFEDVLDTFPLLASLECMHAINNITDASATTYPHLKKLILSHTLQDNFGSDQINSLTKRLPALEFLCLHRCEDTYALSLIQDNCPKLKYIMYNNTTNEDLYMERITYKGGVDKSSMGEDDNGLQLLAINQGCEETLMDVNVLDVMRLMIRNAASLQLIYLRCESFIDMREHHAMYENVVFSHLTYYTHEIFCDEDVMLAICVVRRSPNLKHVELLKGHAAYEDEDEGSYDVLQSPEYDCLDQVFAALTGLPHLEVVNVFIKGRNAAPGLEQFLLYHDTIESKLREFYVPKRTPLSLDTLDMLTRLPRLEDFSIQPLVMEGDPWFAPVYQFLENLAERCPHIHNLSLYDIHEDHLPALRRFPNLQKLWLKCEDFAQDKLLIFLEFPSLKSLFVDFRWIHSKGVDLEIERLLLNAMHAVIS